MCVTPAETDLRKSYAAQKPYGGIIQEIQTEILLCQCCVGNDDACRMCPTCPRHSTGVRGNVSTGKAKYLTPIQKEHWEFQLKLEGSGPFLITGPH